MAELLKGLSIDLGLDTIKVDRGLKGLKDSLKTVNSEMKANMSAFDKSDKSVEKYEKRLEGLNKKLDLQKQVTKEAQAEYEKMVAEHGEGSKEAEKAAREYNNQAAALNNLERYVEDATKELEAMRKEQKANESGWMKLSKSMDKNGKNLKKFGDGMSKVGARWTKVTAGILGGVTALTGGLFMMTNKATEAADGIAKGAEKIGTSTDFYQEMDFWASQNGLSHEDMEKAIGRLNQRMGLAVDGNEKYATALERLGVDLDGVRDGSVSTEDAMAQSISTLSEMSNESEKSALASELFGTKLARELMPALNDGSLSMEDARKKAQELGLVMSEDQLQAAEAFQDAQDQIKRSMGAVAMQIGLDLMPYFQSFFDLVLDNMPRIRETIMSAFDNIVDKVKGVISWWQGLSGGTQKLITTLGGLALAFGPILMITGKVLSVFGTLMIALSPLMAKIAKAGGLIKWLSPLFTALTGPVGITVGLIAALATGFTIAYKKSEGFRNFIGTIKEKISPAIDGFKLFIGNIKEIGNYFLAIVEDGDYMNDWIMNIPESIRSPIQRAGEIFAGLRDKIISAFEKAKEIAIPIIDAIKDGFKIAGDLIQKAFGAAMDFVQEKIAQVKSFWDSNGAQIFQAFQNVFNGIWGVVKPVIDWIVDAVVWAFPFIQTTIGVALNVALGIVKMIWGNIKGVINGALDVIMGLVKTFSSLFTGDWSGMWEGIKQVLSGAVQFIWNFIQLSFFGKLIKGGVVFIKSFAGFFSTMWTGIKNTFSNVIKWIVEFVKNRFTSMQNTVSNLTTGIRDLLSRIWNFIWNGIIKPIIKSIVDFVKNRFTSMRDTTSNIFTGIRDTAQRLWNAVKEKIWNPVKNVVKNVRDRFTTLKDNVSGIFSTMRDNVSEWVGKMVQNVKDMPGKMKDGLVQMAYKVKDGVKDLGQKMMDGIGGGVNGVIGGVNWVLGKLQVPKDKQLVEWDVPQLAHGTKSHKGGPAILNDGKGDNAGEELIINPDGTTGMYRGKNVLANLAKGAQVIPAKMTRQLLDSGIPAYAKGIFGSALDDIKSGVTWTSDKISAGYNYAKDTTIAAGKKIGEWTGNVWDYVENPGKLLNIALEKVGVSIPDGVGAMIEMAKGAFTTVKDKAIDFVKEKLNMGGPEGVSGGMGLVGAAGNWRSQIQRAAAQMGETVSPTEINGILAQINRESGGNQRIVQSSAVWDVNTAAGNPARGLLQYIPQTFNAYKVKGHGNIYSGYDQLLAFFNNRTWRRDLPYGRRGWGPRGGRKYKQGTNYVPEDGPAYLHKGEAVIPAAYNRPAGRTEAMKLLALAGKQIAKNNSPNQQSNLGVGNSAGIEYLESMVSLLSQQVDDLKQIILLLTQLVAKNPNLQIGEHEFKTFISNLTDKGLNEIGNKKKNAWGGA